MSGKSSLYPDILFHFTKEQINLFDILDSNFKVSYAREKVEGLETKREFAVPMVSFCDLKLSELKVHMGNYGNFGIGLTKEWANRNGLNPVMYINKYCPFTDNFNNSLNSVFKKLELILKVLFFKEFQKIILKYLMLIDISKTTKVP
jgi:hypothetical protein